MNQKTDPSEQSALSDFLHLRSELIMWFSSVPEFLTQAPSKDAINIALNLGKFLEWHGPLIDRNAETVRAIVRDNIKPLSLPPEPYENVTQLGAAIRRSALTLLTGGEIKVTGKSIFSLHEKFDRMEAMLAKQGGVQ